MYGFQPLALIEEEILFLSQSEKFPYALNVKWFLSLTLIEAFFYLAGVETQKPQDVGGAKKGIANGPQAGQLK